MGIQEWTWVTVGLTFSAYLYIGYRSRVRTTAGFYVAGKGVPAALLMALSKTLWKSVVLHNRGTLDEIVLDANRSISQEVVQIIKDYLARPARPSREATEALLELCGTWEDERSALEIARQMRKDRRRSRGVIDFDVSP